MFILRSRTFDKFIPNKNHGPQVTIYQLPITNNQIMRNEPNFQKSQVVVTQVLTRNYNEKRAMDTWSKRTQTNPIYGELVEPFIVSLPVLSAVEGSNRRTIKANGFLRILHLAITVFYLIIFYRGENLKGRLAWNGR